MIINTGQRTDIPAWYSDWFCRRLEEGYVLVRNPYDPGMVTRYRLDPRVVDLIGFCTKNPAPMLEKKDLMEGLLGRFRQFWYVTITGYGRDLEPHVPPTEQVIKDFRRLSERVGRDRIGWRYDPILITGPYTADWHLDCFRKMAADLEGYTDNVVISFIDLYGKVKRNFPEAEEVSPSDRLRLGREITEIASGHGMSVRPCGEGDELSIYGADCRGCMTPEIYERAAGEHLLIPKDKKGARAECACYLSCDIGAYNSCGHLCRYCYANSSPEIIRASMKRHDPRSPFLIGGPEPGDRIHDALQESWIDRQIRLEDLI